jgi:hypothetical protein
MSSTSTRRTPHQAAAPASSPKGVAFEIADLVLVRRWAGLHACRMVVCLDHGVDGEEYEEVITFHTGATSYCQLIMWRNAMAVFVQPLIGRAQRYDSVAEALGSIDLKSRIVLTDITATSWPTE